MVHHNEIVKGEMERNLDSVGKAGPEGDTTMELASDFVMEGRKIEGVLGMYFGLDGTGVNLMVVVKTKKDQIDFGAAVKDAYSNLDSKLFGKYCGIDISLRMVGSSGRGSEEFGREMPWNTFMDDYEGKKVVRVYP